MDKYEWIEEIGKGSFGSVSKIRRKADGRILVWKELNYGKMKEKEKKQLVAEVNILRELRHQNIVRYHDRVIDKDTAKLYIVMEYCAKGDMAQLVRRRRRTKDYIPEPMAWKILAQMTLALLECHHRKEGNKILHRDLKPGNVFIDAEDNIKIGDFGLSRMMGDESVFAYTHVGTPYYMSPEQISEQRYNEKSDIWSAGCVLYEIVALRAPFEATNQIQLAYKIKLGKIDPIPSPHFSDELFEVIQSMLSLDQNKRPSVEKLMMHPKVCFVVKTLEIKRMEQNLKRKEDEIYKKDKLFREKVAQIESKIKQVTDKEALVAELEQRVKQKEASQQLKINGIEKQQYSVQENQDPNSNKLLSNRKNSLSGNGEWNQGLPQITRSGSKSKQFDEESKQSIQTHHQMSVVNNMGNSSAASERRQSYSSTSNQLNNMLARPPKQQQQQQQNYHMNSTNSNYSNQFGQHQVSQQQQNMPAPRTQKEQSPSLNGQRRLKSGSRERPITQAAATIATTSSTSIMSQRLQQQQQQNQQLTGIEAQRQKLANLQAGLTNNNGSTTNMVTIGGGTGTLHKARDNSGSRKRKRSSSRDNNTIQQDSSRPSTSYTRQLQQLQQAPPQVPKFYMPNRQRSNSRDRFDPQSNQASQNSQTKYGYQRQGSNGRQTPTDQRDQFYHTSGSNMYNNTLTSNRSNSARRLSQQKYPYQPTNNTTAQTNYSTRLNNHQQSNGSVVQNSGAIQRTGSGRRNSRDRYGNVDKSNEFSSYNRITNKYTAV